MTLKINNIEIISELSVEEFNNISGGNNNTNTLIRNNDKAALVVLPLEEQDNVNSNNTNGMAVPGLFYSSSLYEVLSVSASG